VVGPGSPPVYLGAETAATVKWENGTLTEERIANLQPVSRTTAGARAGVSMDSSTRGRADWMLQRSKADKLQEFSNDAAQHAPRKRNDSQWCFAEREQTFIALDWDDTLFPTNYLFEQLGLNIDVPVARQPRLNGKTRDIVMKSLARCEEHALRMLKLACCLGHAVVVTLAAAAWVDKACARFYPRVGKLLKTLQIKVVYAQNPSGVRKAQAKAKKEEQFWGLLKGFALSEEINKFYSQYEGQSWKNVISIGDSVFERYGLLAASTAYMHGRRLSKLGPVPPFAPTQDRAWEKIEDDEHLIRLRVKCCKLVDEPDIGELTVELDTVSKWLKLMVSFDSGFDLDFDSIENEEEAVLVESVLRGERPITDLPKASAIKQV